MRNVVWIGGGCGAGKSTLARMLAFRFDLRLYRVDSFAYPHQRRIDPVRHPQMARLAALSHTERFVDPSPAQLAADFTAYAHEAFAMVLDDLAALADGPLVIAEGPSLLPELVAPVAASAGHTIWLLPTSEFTDRNLSRRFDPHKDDPDAKRRHDNRIGRDRLLTEAMRASASKHGLPVLDVDGSLSLEQTADRLSEHFADVLAAGPRARDGAERSRLRRAENTETHTAVTMFLESLGDAAPEDPPPVTFACECETLGCQAEVALPPSRYPSLDDVIAH
ncbi:hypothetical protein [Stackebrandtia nassauensis]|uniref:Uncharacterized protein n=1 Tax=Stackebrandtia nassauensis (strain DSM 44728 / CIP 108903 / NRRL B-16338 / NBRC 102104 / LLR-40K-21) TaxID=446470 RepID=D3Q9S8_STANL|nr:hypothetical protein [Stackebrandtia nassauensis]ADD44624.1 hypothetical protein Snas_4987 [Stackebrandtia nassauensis DSM 44728]